MFSIIHMENIFNIGAILEAQFHDKFIDYFDAENWFAFALDLAQRFEDEYPDTDDYYGDLDKFVEESVQQLLRKEK